jgi:hypothetical protein
MAKYIITPKGDLVDISVVGRVRASDTGLLILGKGSDELIEYEQCPREVAKAWRDALVEYMLQLQNRRPAEPPKWGEIAVKTDLNWARSKGYSPAAGPATAPRS